MQETEKIPAGMPFSALLENIPAGVCVFEKRAGRAVCTAANRACSALAGAGPGALTGLLPEQFPIHPQDLGRLQALSEQLRKGDTAHAVLRVRDEARGRWNWVGVTVRPEDGPGGRYWASCDDLNTSVQVERALGESHHLLRSIVQYVPGGVFVYSAESDEKFSFVSENMVRLTGCASLEDFYATYGERFSGLIYAPDREKAQHAIWEQAGRSDFDTCEYRIEKKDGTMLWVHDEGHLITDSAGRRWFYVVVVDVTQSVQASRALADTNQKLRQLIDSIPVRVVVYKKVGGDVRAVAVNGYAGAGTPARPERLLELDGAGLLGLVDPGDREETVRFFGRLFDGTLQTGELVQRITPGADGVCIWYRCGATRTEEADGSVAVYTVYTDATLQQEREADFRRIIQELLTSDPHTLCAFRLNLSRNLCSDCHGASAYTRQLLEAHTADELLEKIVTIIPNEQDAAAFRRQYSRRSLLEAYGNGVDRVNATYRRLTDNGEPHWVTTHFHVLKNPSTGDVEAIASSVDSDHEHKQSCILGAITSREYDCIGLIDPSNGQLQFFYCTPALRAAGLPDTYGDAVKRTLQHLAEDADSEAHLRESTLPFVLGQLAAKEVCICSYSCLEPDGRRTHKQVSYRWLDADRREIMFARADVTEAFEHEENYAKKLRGALLEAEHASEMKTYFLGNVSHDMRTPLNAILGYDALAQKTDDPGELHAYLEKIGVAGDTLLSLINDTLDLQKIETGAVELRPEPVSCGELIREIVTSVRPLMDAHRIRFVLDNDRAVMATINVDRTRVREIFINLLSNAAKFTPEGGEVTLTVECVRLEPDRVHDRIRVRDTGVGMSPAFVEKMYEPFAQERTPETAGIAGSGLGLTIVRRLVGLMGGRIEAVSEPGKGTGFTVWLDFERVDDRLPDAPRTGAESDIRGLHALLCEDNAMNTEIAKRVLEMYGMSVETASDGEEGAERFERSAPGEFDLILMDIRMPRMDGYTAARRIRAGSHPQAKTIPILAMSADAYASDVLKAQESGMDGHVAKPIDPARLAEKIAALCRPAGPKNVGR